MKAQDTLHKTFGKLQVIEITKINNKPHATVKCECGTIKKLLLYSLTTGNTKSCGSCLKTTRVGERYGQLLVLSASIKNKQTYLHCKCDCGKLTNFSNSRWKKRKSCGCLFKEHQRTFLGNLSRGKQPAHTKPKGYAAAGCVYKNYIAGAKKRDLEFSIEKEDFLKLTKLNCHYCGAAPYTAMKADDGKRRLNGDYIYNGLDRMNSDLGYILVNVVTCCRLCNRLKGDLTSYDEFIKIVELLKATRGPDIWCDYLNPDLK